MTTVEIPDLPNRFPVPGDAKPATLTPGVIPDRKVTLPISGREATISGRRLTGQDKLNFDRYAKHGDSGPVFAFIAAVTIIDGKQLVFEDVVALDMGDIQFLDQSMKDDPRFPKPPQPA